MKFNVLNKKPRHIVISALLWFSVTVPAQEVSFSVPGGFYDDVFPVALTCNAGIIHYTTNGNTPTTHDPVYQEPLILDESLYSRSDIYTIQNCPENNWYKPKSVQHCIVIRAAVFDAAGNRVSEVATNTYLIQSLGCDTHRLPVLSLCADSLDLFDYENGIMIPGAHFNPSNPDWSGNYYQTGREWERPANVEFYEKDNRGINQRAGLRTQGATGRSFLQKGLKIYARKEYGEKRFNYRFFEDAETSSFKRLKLKPFEGSWQSIGCQDYICGRMAQSLNIECLASRPMVLFLNGEYWGIYFLQEKPDEHYLEDHFDANPDQVNIIKGWSGECEQGSNDGFFELYHWIEENDLSIDENYQYVASKIDIRNFIDYQIFEIFTVNRDWPANNVRCWQESNGPLRWIFYDGDACLTSMKFDALANATYDGDDSYPSNRVSSLFLRKLLQNTDFKTGFLDRFNQLLSSAFNYNTTKTFFDEAYTAIADEIPNQSKRFNNPSCTLVWKNKMNNINNFLEKRVDDVYKELFTFFNADNDCITISVLYPTPAQSEIHAKIEAKEPVLTFIQIFNIMGQPLFTSFHTFVQGENEITLPTPFSSGIYVLRIGNASTKFIVTN